MAAEISLSLLAEGQSPPLVERVFDRRLTRTDMILERRDKIDHIAGSRSVSTHATRRGGAAL